MPWNDQARILLWETTPMGSVMPCMVCHWFPSFWSGYKCHWVMWCGTLSPHVHSHTNLGWSYHNQRHWIYVKWVQEWDQPSHLTSTDLWECKMSVSVAINILNSMHLFASQNKTAFTDSKGLEPIDISRVLFTIFLSMNVCARPSRYR